MRALSRAEIVQQMRAARVVAVIRTPTEASALLAARALAAGGVTCLEITSTVPNAARAIATLREELPAEVLVGAGTIITPEQAREVLAAGASFLVSPVLTLDLIPLCHEHDAAIVPAGLTPTELYTAWKAGADVVKLFPAGAVGGARYVADVLAPLPQLPLMPSGGIEPRDVPTYLAAGCHCAGLGGSLIPKHLLNDLPALTDHVRQALSATEA